jgi:WD40 repeat protein
VTGDTVSVQDLRGAPQVAVLRGHEAEVTAAAFLPGDKLLTASRDGTLRVWDLGRRDPIVEIKHDDREKVEAAAFVNGGREVLASPECNRYAGKWAALWDAANGALVREVVTEKSLATSPLHKQLLGDLMDLDVSPDGTRLVTVHFDRNPCADQKAEPKPSPLYTPVRVWDLRTGQLLYALPGLRRCVATARFSPDGQRILTFSDGDYNGALVTDKGEVYSGFTRGSLWVRVDLWDADTGKPLHNLVPEANGGGAFALWSRDGKRILTNANYGRDSAADVFDADSFERVCRLRNDDNKGIDHAAISPDGKLVLGYRTRIIADKHLVDVWDAVTGARRFTLRGHTGDVTSATFSPDGRTILTTSTDHTARLWDAATGKQRRALRGHRQVVRAGRFSPDGKWLVTASTDGTARIWDAESGAEWMTLPVASELYDAEFSPDGLTILTTSADGVARIWPTDPLPLARARKPRQLTADERARFQIEGEP